MKPPPALLAGPLDGTEPAWVHRDGRWKLTSTGAIAALAVAAVEDRLRTIEAGLVAQAARLAAIEGREEAAHFTGTAKWPAVAVLTPVTIRLANLTPARPGDVLAPGEPIVVVPRSPLPPGLNIAAATVAADGGVVLQLTATLNVAAGSAAATFDVTALR